MNKAPLVSILTINYNSYSDTLELMESLYGSTYKNFEIVLVDNNSDYFDSDKILDKYPEVKIVRSKTNLGFAGGNNLGLSHCKGDLIFFVNNDTILEPDCIEILINTANELGEFGALSPKFHYLHTPKLIEYAGCPRVNILTARTKIIGSRKIDNGEYVGLIQTAYTHGGGMLVPRTVIDDVGQMYDGYFLYYEELDWCERILKAGYKIYCQRDTIIYHKESASVGKSSPLKVYYMNRSRILFMRRNYNGINLAFFYLYYIFISLPKNALKYLFYGDNNQLKAYIKSLLWQLNPKYEL